MTELQKTIEKEMTFVLRGFTRLAGQCLSGSVAICKRFSEAGIDSYVALGTLTCNNIIAYQYEASNFETSGDWSGHAWCVVENNWIVDITLLQTALKLPQNSNIKRNLISLQGGGAIAFKKRDDVWIFGDLVYSEQAILPKSKYDGLLTMLLDTHGHSRQ